MTERVNNPLSLPKSLSFFRAVQNQDCFTILWELADYSPVPVPFETIRRTFGAEPTYLASILERLLHWGIARRAGRHWTVHKWAKTTLDSLEEMIANMHVDVAQTGSFGTQIQASTASEVATNDGFWIGVASLVSGDDILASKAAHTATAELTLDVPEKPRNETRSHDYK